eukprot:TRINITY_DN2750_c0_g1_i4.p1 TRINITY_DN2750_c0_g1~~TRINITY_DN2750_c0_g1_i4.p1  ORF type:complete len:351 (-),score=70.68 TRINITY_DN2750_c0_g1_i4:100-1152(-)
MVLEAFTMLPLIVCLSLFFGICADLHTKPTIGIVSAFAPEIEAYIDLADDILGNVTSAGRLYTIASFNGKTVSMTLCGVGMVNAALTTQNFIDMFPNLQLIIFSGIAGGINPAYQIGDVLIPQKWANMHHQKYVRPVFSADGGELTKKYADFGVDFPNAFYRVDGDFIGLTRTMDNMFCERPEATSEDLLPYIEAGAAIVDGFSIPMNVQVVSDPDDFYNPVVPAQFWFEVNDDFLEAAYDAIDEGFQLEDEGLSHTPIVNISYAGGSSDTFVDNAVYRSNIFRTFEVDVVDMESAAFMHVCATNKIECAVVRSVSDLAGGNDEGNQLSNFLGLAATNMANVLISILEKL